jgi:UDP-N-acetylglucosamine acyltransferase
MAVTIHPTAIVEATAELADGVEVGALAYVGHGVRLGAGTKIHHHGSVEGNTSLGSACEVFPYACIGAKTQDLKYKGGNPGVRVGDRNVFREYVSVHAATNDGDYTVIGSDNLLLAYTHVAHECVLGNHIIMSNYAGLAGHVQVDDHALIAAYGGVHQFCRIGLHSMIGGAAKVVQDVPPYFIIDGSPATVRTINKVGLERCGYTPEQMNNIRQIFRILYRDGLNRSQALERLATHEAASSAEFKRMLEFAQKSERGLAPGN